MLAIGQLVATPIGERGRIVTLSGSHFVSLEENSLKVRAVLMASGEVRLFAEASLRPLTHIEPDAELPRQVITDPQPESAPDDQEHGNTPPLRRRGFRK